MHVPATAARTGPEAEIIASFRDFLTIKIASAIGTYLPALEDPFFLIAATGLGKTVVVPVHLLSRRLDRIGPGQRVWVVEPKVAIAQSLAATMNRFWEEFQKERGLQAPPLFGCRTKVDRLNPEAPIVFVTTGIFSIYGRQGRFSPDRDGLLVDEAHATLETDHAFELAIGLCRKAGVRIDYMSASVDATSLEKHLGVKVVRALPKRHPIWKVATGKGLVESVTDVVQGTLIRFQEAGPFAPTPGHPNGRGVAEALQEQGRAKGLLVIVPTYAGRDSDAQKVLKALRRAPFADQLRFGLLSGETLRDPFQRKRYLDDIERWKREKARYVLVATSVVEMGVTLPDLDVVVTSDEDIEADGETGRVSRVPLGVNALIQRIGRVGRERPGLAVIVKEAGAPYADLDAARLNDDATLKPEPIRFPMRNGRLTWLAWQSFAERVSDELLLRWTVSQKNPSDSAYDRLEDLRFERRLLRTIAGLIEGDALSEEARRLEKWVGRFDVAVARTLLSAAREGDVDGLELAARRTALSAADPALHAAIGRSPRPKDEMLRWHKHRWLDERYGALAPDTLRHAAYRGFHDARLEEDAKGFGLAPKGVSAFLDAVDEVYEMLALEGQEAGFTEASRQVIAAHRS